MTTLHPHGGDVLTSRDGAQTVSRRRPSLPQAKKVAKKAGLNVAALGCILWFCLPFLWLVRSSLSPVGELRQRPPAWLPTHISLDNYGALFEALLRPVNGYTLPELIIQGLRNSIIVASIVTLINLVLGLMAAYGLSRMRVRFGGAILMGMMASKIIPAFAIIIPLFLVYIRLGLYDTHTGLIVAELSATLPFTVWILKNYLDSISRELDEAAGLDGASRRQTLMYVIAPVAAPGLVAAGIFAFMIAWNSFVLPLVLSANANVMTVQPLLASAYGAQRAEYGILFAGAVVTAIPPLILAFTVRRHLASGLLSGSAKG